MNNQPNSSQTFEVPIKGRAILAFVLLLFPNSLPAEETAISREKIQNLISTLNASTLAERTRAERQLLDLGPAVLPKLPVLETVESLSARESLRRIRVQLERRAARESSGPSTVTYHGRHRLDEIIEQIQQQTGNPIELSEELRKVDIDVNWEKTVFWNCLDDLWKRHDIRWECAKDSTAIQLSRTNPSSLQPRAIQVVGPFRMDIDNVETRDVAGESHQKLLRVNFRISVEPRLRPLSLYLAAADLKAVLGNDLSLAPWNPEAQYEHPVRDAGHQVLMYWDFILPDTILPDTVKDSVLEIRGKIHCQIAAATERIVFDQTSLTRGTIRRRGGVSVRLRDVTFSPVETKERNVEIGVAVNYDAGGPAFESHRTWVFHNAVYLETDSGKRTTFADFETTQQTDGTVAVDYRWQKIPAPLTQYRFVYEAPTLIINVPIEFEIGKISIGR